MPDFVWVAVGYFAVALVSAMVPWVNAEVVMFSAVPVARSPIELAILVSAVTAGQMTGKAGVFWAGRRASRCHRQRLSPLLDPWQARLQSSPRAALGVTFVSATVGFPPPFLVAMAAGAFDVAFGPFLAAGTLGRLIHFAIIACLPSVTMRWLW